MKKSVWLLGILVPAVLILGCCGKRGDQPQAGAGKDLALKFLQGIQAGDKDKMYEAANLTAGIVNESREKLIRSKQNKLTDGQREDSEYALRISGQIDFFLSKIRKMLPQSASLQITQTKAKGLIGGSGNSVHFVRITYLSRDEAMRDKTGRPVREMVVHLQQINRTVNGRSLHEFSFEGKDFEKLADRDFEVLSYFQ